MDDIDTGAVQAMTASLHRADCLPGTPPVQKWVEEHRRRDERKALEILDDLAERGWKLTGVAS